jgi:DNA-binding response OmpR family regulator
MNKVQIMIVGETEQNISRIMEMAAQQDNLDVSIAHDAETAINLFQQSDFDIILFSNTMDEVQKRKLSRLFRFQDEHVMLVELDHNAPEALLMDALRKRRRMHKPVYAFTDDALKEAIFNINLS